MYWRRTSRKSLPRSQVQCLAPRNLYAAAQFARNRYDSPGSFHCNWKYLNDIDFASYMLVNFGLFPVLTLLIKFMFINSSKYSQRASCESYLFSRCCASQRYRVIFCTCYNWTPLDNAFISVILSMTFWNSSYISHMITTSFSRSCHGLIRLDSRTYCTMIVISHIVCCKVALSAPSQVLSMCSLDMQWDWSVGTSK